MCWLGRSHTGGRNSHHQIFQLDKQMSNKRFIFIKFWSRVKKRKHCEKMLPSLWLLMLMSTFINRSQLVLESSESHNIGSENLIISRSNINLYTYICESWHDFDRTELQMYLDTHTENFLYLFQSPVQNTVRNTWQPKPSAAIKTSSAFPIRHSRARSHFR